MKAIHNYEWLLANYAKDETKHNIIAEITFKHEVKVEDIAKALEVTTKTARDNLQALCSLKILERVSEKQRDKNAIYRFIKD